MNHRNQELNVDTLRLSCTAHGFLVFQITTLAGNAFPLIKGQSDGIHIRDNHGEKPLPCQLLTDKAHFLLLVGKGIGTVHNIIDISRHFFLIKAFFDIRNGEAHHLYLLALHDNRRHLRQFVQLHPDILTNLQTLAFKAVLDADQVLHVFADTLFFYANQGNGFLNFLHDSACCLCIFRQTQMLTEFCRQTFRSQFMQFCHGFGLILLKGIPLCEIL